MASRCQSGPVRTLPSCGRAIATNATIQPRSVPRKLFRKGWSALGYRYGWLPMKSSSMQPIISAVWAAANDSAKWRFRQYWKGAWRGSFKCLGSRLQLPRGN
jgi:hypothetical protein